jgi:probable addiction module antidote protein
VTAEDFRPVLLQQLKNPDVASEYLTKCFEEGGTELFLIALRNVVEALGGLGTFARNTALGRQSLYTALSKDGNPTLQSLHAILDSAGITFSFRKKKRAA